MDQQIPFIDVVQAAFRSWSSLQYVMDQHSGMRMTNTLTQWMAEELVKFFENNDNLEEWEVADWLYEVVDKNTNVRLDDGSSDQTAHFLCKTHDLLKHSRFNEVQAELNQLPSYDPSLFTVQADQEGEGEAGLAAVNDRDSSSESEDNEPMELTEQKKLELDDGWTNVKSRLKTTLPK